MNSARVAGGVAPAPSHSIVPEPQSPVTQVNVPVLASWVQRVRPQRRPDHPAGTEMGTDSPRLRAKPVEERGAVPAPDKIPGQTV